MGIQLLVILLALIGACILMRSRTSADKQQRLFIGYVCVLLTLQSGLRNVAVGADTYAYYLIFEDVKSWSWSQVFENFHNVYILGEGKDAGYDLLLKVFQLFSEEYQVYLLAVAIFFFYTLYVFLYQNTFYIRDIIFALIIYQALFYNFFSITGVRQTIATGMALMSYEFMKKKKFWHCCALILLGAFIHKSVLVFLPFYFIANIKNSKVLYIMAAVIFPFLMTFGNTFALQLALLSGSDNYLAYADDTTSGAWGFLFFFVFIVLWGVLYYKNTIVVKGSYRLHNAMAVSVFFIPLTFVSAPLMRIVQYYSIFLLLFFPLIVNTLNKRNSFLKMVFQILICSLLIYKIVRTNAPFAWCWEYMKLGNNY